MIYNLNCYRFIICENCATLWGYEEKDLRITTDKSYNIFTCEDFTTIKQYFTCPKCGMAVVVSKEEKVK